jgi:GTP-binding protein LepA
MDNIRNFSIIAHVDHGKSTLADRLLEITETIPKRKMREQVLDSMDLERERGITIKMQPVRMIYKPPANNQQQTTDDQNHPSPEEGRGSPVVSREFILNLIDTPGHIDFSYEVSRALKAVEGSILLVDATQGIQAQTISVLNMAQEGGLVIIPVVSKIDSPLARVPEVKKEIAALLSCDESNVLEVSGRTGDGVEALLREVVHKIPPPREELSETKTFRSLIFDFQYSDHTGVIVFVRVFGGELRMGERLKFLVAKREFNPIEIGIFSPDRVRRQGLSSGEIGYIVTGIKEPGIASVGDTVAHVSDTKEPLSGYLNPKPVVWASLYPESQDEFVNLRQSLTRLKLSDSSLSFAEESSGTLGRGFRCGFLGMLHLEIVTERLKREFNIALIITSPGVTYQVTLKNGKKTSIYSAAFFPDGHEIKEVLEPWVRINVISPNRYSGSLVQILYEHEAKIEETQNFGLDRISLKAQMPLRELMRNFFDKIKSLSSGYASVSYEIADLAKADVARIDILVADEVVPAFSRMVSLRNMEEEAEAAVERLRKILPRQLFALKIQAKVNGRIVSSRSLSALRKDVTGYLYGGDITRKKKLWEKQKKGKKRMKERGRVNIPQDVFIKMMRFD